MSRPFSQKQILSKCPLELDRTAISLTLPQRWALKSFPLFSFICISASTSHLCRPTSGPMQKYFHSTFWKRISGANTRTSLVDVAPPPSKSLLLSLSEVYSKPDSAGIRSGQSLVRGQGKNSEEFLTGSPMAGPVLPARACAGGSAGETGPRAKPVRLPLGGKWLLRGFVQMLERQSEKLRHLFQGSLVGGGGALPIMNSRG